MDKSKLFAIIGLVIALNSCGTQDSFEILQFNPLSNFHTASDTLKLNIDLSGALKDGISIPSINRKEKYFSIKFKVRNNNDIPTRFYYKIYYQNESYKYNEIIVKNEVKQKNLKSNNNFYGSWNVQNSGFHETELLPCDNQYHEITDSIRIIDNPRNEIKYFGGEAQNYLLIKHEIEQTMLRIQASESWMQEVREKAKINHVLISEQLYLDAKWAVSFDKGKGDQNNRWKRNPRTGLYSFMLVIADKEDRNKIPDYYQDITITDTLRGDYHNPFYYFLHDPERIDNSKILCSERKLKIKAKIDLSKGIYINPSKLNYQTDFSDTNMFCGFSDDLFFNAHLEQFFHNIDQNYSLENIPLSYDVVSDNYSNELYHLNANKFDTGSLVKGFVKISDSPGKTVGYDSVNNAVFIKNPGNVDNSDLKKENVGVKTRHGFTYGKFRAKIRFPKILSEDNVWNGLTCAFWLLYQEGDWNMREICNSGYIPKYLLGEQSETVAQNEYSEIDIEIVKTSKYWPKSSYGDAANYLVDDGLNNNVIIACTNWDLACHDPDDFNIGVKETIYKDSKFYLHRWDDWYKALTSKYENPQDLTLGNIFYYEIDWQPERIIWRIGADKENMHIIGYMDSNNTKIPDNQMVSAVTQEFHYSCWWPTAPFDQNSIPFPKEDIIGYVYEIEIE